MKRISFYFYRLLLWLTAGLSDRGIQVLSGIGFFVLYRLLGYRKNVARSNLKKCFPDLSEKEIKQKLKSFYQYLAELFVQTMKVSRASEAYLKAHGPTLNPDILDELYEKNGSAIVLMGHYGNWELCGITMNLFFKHRCMVVYQKIANPYIHDEVIKNRTRTGLHLISTEEVVRKKEEIFREPTLLFLIADQNPKKVNSAYWVDFFGNNLPWFSGPEKTAIRNKLPVFFGDIRREKSLYYSLTVDELNYNPLKKGDLTEKFVRRLEQQIENDPIPWLWTHKRWKRAHLYDAEKHYKVDAHQMD